ncbi:hypothetical protein BC834DRAFT_869881 [Gloeopeniophorella convolvens]|nr:hypothetical protein BC834DRAFT_869881 [Gloeopeniophorella convolvens]
MVMAKPRDARGWGPRARCSVRAGGDQGEAGGSAKEQSSTSAPGMTQQRNPAAAKYATRWFEA